MFFLLYLIKHFIRLGILEIHARLQSFRRAHSNCSSRSIVMSALLTFANWHLIQGIQCFCCLIFIPGLGTIQNDEDLATMHTETTVCTHEEKRNCSAISILLKIVLISCLKHTPNKMYIEHSMLK